MTTQPYSQLIHCKRWADQGLYQAIEANFTAIDADEQVMMASMSIICPTTLLASRSPLRSQAARLPE